MRTLTLFMVLVAGLMVVAYYTDHPNKALFILGGSVLEFILACIIYDEKALHAMPSEAVLTIDGIHLSFSLKREEEGIVSQNDMRVNFKAGKGDVSPLAVQVWHEVHNNPHRVTGFLTLAGETIPVTCNKFLAGLGHHYHGEFASKTWKGTFSFYASFEGWKKKPVVYAGNRSS